MSGQWKVNADATNAVVLVQQSTAKRAVVLILCFSRSGFCVARFAVCRFGRQRYCFFCIIRSLSISLFVTYQPH